MATYPKYSKPGIESNRNIIMRERDFEKGYMAMGSGYKDLIIVDIHQMIKKIG